MDFRRVRFRSSSAAAADCLLAVKVNQPARRAEIEAFFADAPAETLDTVTDHDKAHGRIEERSVTVSREAALRQAQGAHRHAPLPRRTDRKSTRLNSSH